MRNLFLVGIALASLLACAPEKKTSSYTQYLSDQSARAKSILTCAAVSQNNKGISYHFLIYMNPERKEKISEKISLFTQTKMTISKLVQLEKDSFQPTETSTIETQIKVEALIFTDADDQKLDATKYTVLDGKNQKVLFSVMEMEGRIRSSQVEMSFLEPSGEYDLTCTKI